MFYTLLHSELPWDASLGNKPCEWWFQLQRKNIKVRSNSISNALVLHHILKNIFLQYKEKNNRNLFFCVLWSINTERNSLFRVKWWRFSAHSTMFNHDFQNMLLKYCLNPDKTRWEANYQSLQEIQVIALIRGMYNPVPTAVSYFFIIWLCAKFQIIINMRVTAMLLFLW